jgi:pimeloyl-ACP methyl ester carboxylesterase
MPLDLQLLVEYVARLQRGDLYSPAPQSLFNGESKMKKNLPAYVSAGHGPAVVLLHCTMSSKNQWRALSASLENDFRVIAIDLYGYGDTAMPEETEQYSLLNEAELVRSLLDEILPPGEPVHLVGHSFGGAVSLAFCHTFPERVRTLTVFEPVAFHLLDEKDPGLQPVMAMMHELSRLLREGRRQDAAATFMEFWNDGGKFSEFPERIQKDFTKRTEKLKLDFVALTRTPLTLQDYHATLKLPVTVIAGRLSRLPALRVAEELSQALPDCHLRWVETGHMGPVTHPELVNPVIIDALSR